MRSKEAGAIYNLKWLTELGIMLISKAKDPAMTITTRKRTKTARRSVRRVTRKSKISLPKTTVTVRLVRPKGTPEAIARGCRLAEQVRRELAALDNASLDETMRDLRGRTWSL
jgi:hypothetical protein